MLILGARKKGPKTQQTGRTVKFVSKDLKNWKFEGDFWAPDLFTMHEMVDLFKIGDWWYHVVTEYSNRSKIVYRMSRNMNGPWIAPKDDAFDGRAYYAGRTFELNGHRILFGWVATKANCDDKSNYEWAGTFVAHEVYQREDGTLGVRIPETVWGAFTDRIEVQNFKIESQEKLTDHKLLDNAGDLFAFEADISFTKGTKAFGIRLCGKEETGESYQFIFNVNENRMVFEKNPNWPWFSYMNIGLERPIDLNPEQIYNIRIILDDTIATIYVNGVALNVRMYQKPGNSIGIFTDEGSIDVKHCSISKNLNR
jgi:beta-fructofuranosidase